MCKVGTPVGATDKGGGRAGGGGGRFWYNFTYRCASEQSSPIGAIWYNLALTDGFS